MNDDVWLNVALIKFSNNSVCFLKKFLKNYIYEVRMRFQGPNLETIEAQTGPSWGWLIFALANFLLICSALLFHWFTLLESMAFVSGMVLGLACFRAEEAWLTSGNILKVRNLVWIVKSYDLSELKWIDVHAKIPLCYGSANKLCLCRPILRSG